MSITPRSLRSVKSEGAMLNITSTRNEAKTFAADSGSAVVTLPVGTPVAFNTSTNLWAPWVSGGSNGTSAIKGLVWPVPVKINATGGGETIGSVMLAGEALYSDLDVSALASSAAQLVTALQEGGTAADLRSLGITILGLDKVI
ncbi:MAG: hypothetical protein JKY94_17540 [Rhodobacteraceae bacterium]|nr:hypothetical protein [Paracoccaceae bacterium]